MKANREPGKRYVSLFIVFALLTVFLPTDVFTLVFAAEKTLTTSVDNSSNSFTPGFYVGTNDNLTYNGSETLTFKGGLQAAGIGGKGVNTTSNTVSADSFIGDVVFGEVGQVGNFKITATGGEWAAGIGDGDTNESNTGINPQRTITINSGIVIGYADKAAGIGTQDALTNTNMVLDFKNSMEGSFAVGASSLARGVGAGTDASMVAGNLKVAGYVMGLATGTNYPISENSTTQAAAIDSNWTIYSFTLTEGVGEGSRIYVTKEGSDLPVYDYTIPSGYTKLAISLRINEKYNVLFGNQGYKFIQTTTENGGEFVNETISPSDLGFATTINLGKNMSLDTDSGLLSQGGSAGTAITPIKLKANDGYQLLATWDVGSGLIYTRNTATTATITGTIQNSNVIATVLDAIIVESGIQTSNGSSSYTISGDGVVIDPNLTIDYSDTISEASVLIRNAVTGDALTYTTVHGITGTYNSTTGVLTLSGNATAEQYQEALRSVKFSTSSSSTVDRTIDFVLGSGLYFNDHFYEYVLGTLTWQAAKSAAESRTLFGRQGYLVTITSQEENDFVSNKTLGLGWIGARDINRNLTNGVFLSGGLSDGDWRWVTGPEGLMDNGKGLKFYNGYVNYSPSSVENQFSNWSNGEPNNSPSEWVVHIFAKNQSTNSGKWNDFYPTNSSVQGYIVEYGGMPNDVTTNIQASKIVEVSDTRMYTVTFTDYNDEVLNTQSILHGNDAIAPTVPNREGYTFKNWNSDFTNVTSDLTVKAMYDVNQYTITFNSDGGSTIESITQNYNTEITPPSNPTKTGYTFTGWNPSLPTQMPLDGGTYTAQWTINEYSITFDSQGGSPVESIIQNFNTTLTPPTPPTKIGYTFIDWDPIMPSTMPAVNTTLRAQWMISDYTITFDSQGGSSIEPIIQIYATTVIPPTDPTRIGYTFSGWSPVFQNKMPAEDITLTAQWTIDTYTVTFVDVDDIEIETQTIDHGSNATAPIAPTIQGYTFTGWDVDFDNVTEDLVVKAEYEINTYTVTFNDYDSSKIKDVIVEHGKDAIAPASPTRDGHTFNGWNATFTNVTSDLTITATYLSKVVEADTKEFANLVVDGLNDLDKLGITLSDIDKEKDVKVLVVFELLNVDAVPKTDQELIDAYLKTNANGEAPMSFFLDISMFKKIGDISSKITELDSPLTISFEVPFAFRDIKFELLRVHNGNVESLVYEYDKDTFILTFKTDKFSTYVLAEVAVESEEDPVIEEPDVPKEEDKETEKEQALVPDTSDRNNSRYAWSLLYLGAFFVLITTKKKYLQK